MLAGTGDSSVHAFDTSNDERSNDRRKEFPCSLVSGDQENGSHSISANFESSSNCTLPRERGSRNVLLHVEATFAITPSLLIGRSRWSFIRQPQSLLEEFYWLRVFFFEYPYRVGLKYLVFHNGGKISHDDSENLFPFDHFRSHLQKVRAGLRVVLGAGAHQVFSGRRGNTVGGLVSLEPVPTAGGPDVLPNPCPSLIRSLPSLTQYQSRPQFRRCRNQHQHFPESRHACPVRKPCSTRTSCIPKRRFWVLQPTKPVKSNGGSRNPLLPGHAFYSYAERRPKRSIRTWFDVVFNTCQVFALICMGTMLRQSYATRRRSQVHRYPLK